jgi:protein phosphatase
MKYYGLSVKGRRENNEDSYLIERIRDFYVFAVADGLGGHEAGEIASKLAIIELKETLKRQEGDLKDLLVRAFKKANDEVFFQNKIRRTNMGTTSTACVVKGFRGIIANVGDSRAYVINDGVWHTKDHSYVQELLDAKAITKEEAFEHPYRNIVTRVIGLDEDVEVDLYEVDLRGKVLLLSTDGLHDYVRDERIREIVLKFEPREACERLVEEALNSGSGDNITVIVVKFD